MSIFIDASALVAMLTLEDGYEALAERLDQGGQPLTSALAIWEATIALSKGQGIMLDLASKDVSAFLTGRGVTVVPVAVKEAALALEANRRFGKGRHRAALNFGDCFAYACAKAHSARLLYKGDDFAHTDLA